MEMEHGAVLREEQRATNRILSRYTARNSPTLRVNSCHIVILFLVFDEMILFINYILIKLY